MQATMVGVLAVTVGAAALLARGRERQWAVTLEPEPQRAGRLDVRPPAGWRVEATVPGVQPVVVRASQGNGGDALRLLQVIQLPTDGDGAGTLMSAYLATRPGVAGAPKPFGFLRQPGVLVPFVAHYRASPAPQVPPIEVPEWYAATVVPGQGEGGANLGVILHLAGPAAGGPSGRAVLRLVGDGLTLSEPSTTQPPEAPKLEK